MAHPYQSAAHKKDPKWLDSVRKYADGGDVPGPIRWQAGIRLRNAMAGKIPWHSTFEQRTPEEAQDRMRGQAGHAKDISDAVPRKSGD